MARQKLAQNEKYEETASPPENGIHCLERHIATPDSEYLTDQVGEMIKSTGVNSERIGPVRKAVQAAADLAGVWETCFIGQPAVGVKSTPHDQYQEGVREFVEQDRLMKPVFYLLRSRDP
jgi:hypothetical protein